MKEDGFLFLGIGIALMGLPASLISWLCFAWSTFPIPFFIIYAICCITIIITTMINLWLVKPPPMDLSDPKDPLE